MYGGRYNPVKPSVHIGWCVLSILRGRQDVAGSVHFAIRTRASRTEGTLQDKDLEASRRLQEAVTEAYGKPAHVTNEFQLVKVSGVARTTVDGYLRKGTQPGTEQMRRIARALGVPAEQLWLRWLGYEPPEPGLVRIAEEISRLRRALTEAGGDPATLPSVRVAIDAAREDQEEEPGDVRPSEPDASVPPRTPGAGTRPRSGR